MEITQRVTSHKGRTGRYEQVIRRMLYVKLIVIDAIGNPVTDGVNTYVSIGDSLEVLAVLDDAITGHLNQKA